jgi:hypothetical protein
LIVDVLGQNIDVCEINVLKIHVLEIAQMRRPGKSLCQNYVYCGLPIYSKLQLTFHNNESKNVSNLDLLKL